MDPFKVLGVSANSVRGSADLDKVRQRSKELYKRYAQEKRPADAKRVCEAWELIKRKFEKKKEGVSRTSSSHSLKDRGHESRATAAAPAKDRGHQLQAAAGPAKEAGAPSAQPASAAAAAPTERPAEPGASAARRPRAEAPKDKAAAAERKAAAHGARSVVRLPSGSVRLPGSSPREAASSGSGRAPSRQLSAASSMSRKGSASSLKRQASAGSLHKQASTSSLTPRSTSKKGLDKEGSATLVCACGERVPRRAVKQAAGFSCPACRVRAMDPFNAVLEGRYGMLRMILVQPPAVPKTARQEASLKFHLNLPKLQRWRKLGHNIEVRMCLLTNFLALQAWPKSLELRVNERKVFDVAPPTPLHVRRDVPQNISAALHSGTNAVTVQIRDDYVQRFALAIVRTVPRLPRQICKHVPLNKEDQCRQRIVELIFSSVLEGSSEEVQCGQGHDRCRLVCPITLARMQTPARGYKCRHLQCFDLVAYLVSNLRMSAFNKRWLCPVCDLVLRPPKELFIDTYLVKILAAAEADVEEVAFDQNANWTVSARAEPVSPDSDVPEEPAEAPDAGAEPPGALAARGSAESLAVDEVGSEAEPEEAEPEEAEHGDAEHEEADNEEADYEEVDYEEASSDEGGEACLATNDVASSPPGGLVSPQNTAEGEREGGLDDELSSTTSGEFRDEGDGSPQLELPADLPDDGTESEELLCLLEQKAAEAAAEEEAAAAAAAAGKAAAEEAAAVSSPAPAEPRCVAAQPPAPAPAPGAGAAPQPAAEEDDGAANAAVAALPHFTGHLAIKADISSLKRKLAELKGQAAPRPRGGISGIVAGLPGPGAAAPGREPCLEPRAGAGAGASIKGAKVAQAAAKKSPETLQRKRSRMSASFSEGESSEGLAGGPEDVAAVTVLQ